MFSHSFISVCIAALRVNSTFYKPWTSQVMATLYIRPSRNASFDKLETDLHSYIDTLYQDKRNAWRSGRSKSVSTIFHHEQDIYDDNSSSSSSSEESDEVNSHKSSNPRHAVPPAVLTVGSGTHDWVFRVKQQQVRISPLFIQCRINCRQARKRKKELETSHLHIFFFNC